MAQKASKTAASKSKGKTDEKEQKAAGTAVAQRGSTAVAAVGEIDFGSDAGKGMEGTDKDSFAIPFLLVLQPMSPAVAEGLVEGAEAGMFMNSVTNELFNEVFFIPCAYQRRWIRWAPRNSKGGYKGDFVTEAVQKLREEGKVKELDNRLYFPLDDGTLHEKKCDRLSDTRHHFGLFVPERNADFGSPIVAALTSTGIKRSKNFMARIDGIKMKRGDGSIFTPPSFSHIYRITTVKEQNDEGIWHSPVFDDPRPIANPNLYAAAKAFHQQISAGSVVLATDSLSRNEEGGAAAAGGQGDGF